MNYEGSRLTAAKNLSCFIDIPKAGLEVDLLMDRNRYLYPLEVKMTATLLPVYIDKLLERRQLAGHQAPTCATVANIASLILQG